PVFEIHNAGLPTHYIGTEPPAVEGRFTKLKNVFSSAGSYKELTKNISASINTRLYAMMPQPLTHMLVAGDQFLAIAENKKRGRRFERFIFGHCQDYSNAILKNASAETHLERIGVLLDAPGPMFTSDYAYMKRKVFLTSEVWYPTLSNFFDRIEKKTGTRVRIAGHYKATHPFIAECFGNREVHYHKTMELVRDCDFVVTRSSAAVSYAVLFRKPVVFIYSDQLLGDDLGLFHTFGMAKMLGTEPINIDHPPADLAPFLQVNHAAYEAYEKACLTSSVTNRPNVQIILEDIMKINTEGGFNLLNKLIVN
ncbi:MAG: hypothetical protein ABI581_16355, partial [Sediminibacterium sp.]